MHCLSPRLSEWWFNEAALLSISGSAMLLNHNYKHWLYLSVPMMSWSPRHAKMAMSCGCHSPGDALGWSSWWRLDDAWPLHIIEKSSVGMYSWCQVSKMSEGYDHPRDALCRMSWGCWHAHDVGVLECHMDTRRPWDIVRPLSYDITRKSTILKTSRGHGTAFWDVLSKIATTSVGRKHNYHWFLCHG